jgi:archaellin
MTDATVASPPRKKRRWLRILGWIAGVLIVLLVAAYFVATSSAFLKGVILPRVGASLNADVTVSEASVHPFSQITLRDLKVQARGQAPVLTMPEARLNYSLFDIIGGKIHVDEIALVSPTVALIENPDGSNNLDPILKSQKGKAPEQKAAPTAKPSKPAQIDLRKLTLSNATILKIKNYAGGNRDLIELTNVNITLDDLKNGQTGKLELSAGIQIENNPPAPATYGLLKAALNGSFTFALTPDLKPGSVKGNARLDVSNAAGTLGDLAALGAVLDCDVTPTDIKQVALRLQRGGANLGELLVSGSLDLGKTEGRLKVELLSIDKQILNLAGARSGIDFGPTTINSTHEIQLTNSGMVIIAAGRFNASNVQLTRGKQTTPTLDFRADYDVTLDRAAGTALLRGLDVTGTQNSQRLLRAELTSPMTLAWGGTANAVGDSSLNLAVTNLNLADWKPFLGDSVAAGEVNLIMKLLSQQAGRQLTFDLDSQIKNLTAQAGGNQIARAEITLEARGQAADLKQFNLSSYKLQIAQQNKPVLTVSGSGTYDQTAKSADMQVAVQATLARLAGLLGQADLAASSGSLELKARVTQQSQTQTVTGSLTLAGFTGKLGKNELKKFGSTIDLDVRMTPEQVEIRKATGTLSQGESAGGSFDVSGTYDIAHKSTQMAAKLSDFNQNSLRPFLEPLLADKKLVSIAINGNASAQLNPNGESAVKADLQVANLVVNDPKHQFPDTPQEVKLQVDAALHKLVAEVHQFAITLTPTSRARNQVQLQGQVDMSQTNAIQGSFKLSADSLDVTSYYDLFAGGKKTTGAKAAPAAPAPGATPTTRSSVPEPAPSESTEPASVKLPLHNFTVEADIGELYLHEIAVTNLQATVKLDGGHLLLNPFQLTLNGAPVNATVDLDMSMPGYKYEGTFNADKVPFAPLVDTFLPDRKGQLGGILTAHAHATGTGVTGASLQKNLAGNFDVGVTNLNLAVVNIQSPVLKKLINVIAAIPELLRNPLSAVTSLFGGGLADELNKSPIDVITARGVIGTGRIDLQQAVVRSPAFEADAQGSITLAQVLTNSTIQIPIGISLSRPIGDRLNLTPANTPANAAYVKMPNFLTMTGTLGNPKTDINKLALTGAVVRSVVPGAGGQAGALLQGIGGALTGQTPGSTAPANTNQPAAPVKNLLNQFFQPAK